MGQAVSPVSHVRGIEGHSEAGQGNCGQIRGKEPSQDSIVWSISKHSLSAYLVPGTALGTESNGHTAKIFHERRKER
jgi:hypothetical protein